MKTPEEKRWERMQNLLLADMHGDAPVRLSSQRTLFGIKSHVEQVIESVAQEHSEQCMREMESREGSSD